uniref:Uncharacterized protein n=1 Tax=Oncorhynchus mykiss TaxID=8022 RepID=A0A8C7T2Y7_ONCMY
MTLQETNTYLVETRKCDFHFVKYTTVASHACPSWIASAQLSRCYCSKEGSILSVIYWPKPVSTVVCVPLWYVCAVSHPQSERVCLCMVLFSPGHTEVLVLEEEKGTAMFEDLYDYVKSLQILHSFLPYLISAGHSPVVQDVASKIQHYISHRNLREQQFLTVLQAAVREHIDFYGTAQSRLQGETPERLHNATKVNLVQHLKTFEKGGKITVGFVFISVN